MLDLTRKMTTCLSLSVRLRFNRCYQLTSVQLNWHVQNKFLHMRYSGFLSWIFPSFTRNGKSGGKFISLSRCVASAYSGRISPSSVWNKSFGYCMGLSWYWKYISERQQKVKTVNFRCLSKRKFNHINDS